jgi:enamine deaminase RidA (YjgF/YER057c/UK114 family)
MPAIDDTLQNLGIILPPPVKPVANYVPWTRTGNLVFISGQLPFLNGKAAYPGVLGETVTVEEGVKEARQCAINIIAHLRDACEGDLSRVKRILKLAGFVAATAGFHDHPKVVNGASDLMVAVFGEKGRHARAAVGVSSLPLGVAVEIEAIAELE